METKRLDESEISRIRKRPGNFGATLLREADLARAGEKRLAGVVEDLLEQLKAIEEELGRWLAKGPRHCATPPTVETMRAEIRAAIAKAEGR